MRCLSVDLKEVRTLPIAESTS